MTITTSTPTRYLEAVMGTIVTFDIEVPESHEPRTALTLARARRLLHRFDAIFSLWIEDSPMSRLQRGELAIEEAPSVMGEVLEMCRFARECSDGWFDPWAMPGGFDPTGLVKGLAAQRAAELFSQDDAAVMINAGGDIATSGQSSRHRNWRIGIRDPSLRDRLVALAEIDVAIATSGTYERGSHLIDPHTGRRQTRYASASVTGPDLWLADALATGLAVGGASALTAIEQLDGYEALCVDHQGRVEMTSAFPLS